MTNGTAEKVSDGEPNGVETNGLESTHFDSVHFGLFHDQIHDQVQNLQNGFSVVKSAVTKLTETFNQYGEVVKTVDERYSKDQVLEDHVDKLENENETLAWRIERIKQSHKVQLREQQKQHAREVSGLRSQADSGAQEREKYEKMIKSVKEEQDQAMQKAKEELKQKKAQLEKDNEDNIARLEADKKQLEEKQKDLEGKLEKISKELDQEKENHEATQKKAEAEIKDLKKALANVKAKYEVERLPQEHYAGRYKLLVESVASIASEYFSELPEEAMDNPVGAYNQLRRKKSAFQVVPITESERARVLRLAFVQNIIFDAIRDAVWQPFFSRQYWKSRRDRNLLNEIYIRLAKDGEEIQTDWKVSTLRVLDRLDEKVDVGDKIGTAIDLDVIHKLEPLLSEKQKPDFKSELRNIFTKAMELGQESRRDRSPVYIDTGPPMNGGPGWKEFSEGFTIEDTPNPNLPIIIGDNTFEPLCVSPRIYRKSLDGGEDEVVYPGVALFPSTGIFQQGSMEWQELRQKEREIHKAHNGKARRASMASIVAGLGIAPLDPAVDLKPSKTWASTTIAEYV
ncbi:uncharacterized protein Z519_04606 [Cladophialophora bantiana CBS 173.52]|uniref:Uncharacterized protein n=1 Tax=Cladophialophora bantiana (strain ATCC 10958 / CBS 173.52 / CDC B-1940 / NIH 8579) TaxID=1442370 RepID=A0A0D2HUU7_CLAB1|nr:uncharacterized protein Z519_04606 [Cladophialophora bantiana CBS 173.52]KIW94630.1 hypothetical protein Z519_04606 [Cladophialophora bantiana CBS 173.52]